MRRRIYLDNNATTALHPLVLEAMMVDLTGPPYNPSSVHAYGQEARNLLTKARRSIAAKLGVAPPEILFTSGATEAMNLAIRGLLAGREGHVITSAVEHACVLGTLAQLPNCEVTLLKPGSYGAAQPAQLQEAVRPDTRLIVLMAANNETGVITDLEGVAAVAERANIPLVVDGTAWLGKALFHLPRGVSAATFSSHKIHGPKGVGLLLVRHSLPLRPQITGGGQQYERRGGTENLAGILGMAKAIELLDEATLDPMGRLRDQLEEGILALHPEARVNGEGPRVANTVNLFCKGIDGESLFMNLDLEGIAVSHGAACSSGSLEPSHVLLGMGYAPERARSSVRFSLSIFTSQNEIEETLFSLKKILPSLAGPS
jgi:cysteine desulfurase